MKLCSLAERIKKNSKTLYSLLIIYLLLKLHKFANLQVQKLCVLNLILRTTPAVPTTSSSSPTRLNFTLSTECSSHQFPEPITHTFLGAAIAGSGAAAGAKTDRGPEQTGFIPGGQLRSRNTPPLLMVGLLCCPSSTVPEALKGPRSTGGSALPSPLCWPQSLWLEEPPEPKDHTSDLIASVFISK